MSLDKFSITCIYNYSIIESSLTILKILKIPIFIFHHIFILSKATTWANYVQKPAEGTRHKTPKIFNQSGPVSLTGYHRIQTALFEW